MLVSKEEHDCCRVVQFYWRDVSVILEKKEEAILTIHLLEVRDLVEIAHIDDGKVLDSISDTYKDARLLSAI